MSKKVNILYILLFILCVFLLFVLYYYFYRDNTHKRDNRDNRDNIRELRKQIDKIDNEILDDIYRRSEIVKKIWKIKEENNIPLYNKDREQFIFEKIRKKCMKRKLDEKKVIEIYQKIVGKDLIDEESN